MQQPPACPQCGSADVRHRPQRDDWFCDACDHRWRPDRPLIFLSYGRRDAAGLAESLAADLPVHGYDVWRDTQEIRSGRSWSAQIEEALGRSRVMIALLSPHAVRQAGDPDCPDQADSVCLDEISFARFERRIPIVPILAADCRPPFDLFRLDYVDLRDPARYAAGLGRLLEAIAAALRGEVRYRSWDGRLRPWDFGAFLDERRRHFCGREWLFAALDDWRRDGPRRVLLITGDPGVGKSAVVAELVHRNPGGQVLAYHCCRADVPDTLRPGPFVRSLAAMIAAQIDGYAAGLGEPALEDALGEGRCAQDPVGAFEQGILAPLRRLPAPAGGPCYLLIDALDEALALREAGGGATIVDVLAAHREHVPDWLRVVATTRKEAAVLDRLQGLRAQELDAHDPRNVADLERYLRLRLAEPGLAARQEASGVPQERAVAVLRERSDGNFLYARQVLDGLADGLYGFDQLDALPPGLSGLYRSFFVRHFPDEASYAPVKKVLQVVVAVREPLTAPELARATGLDEDEELPRVLLRLSSYLPERSGRYSVYHSSLADWLTGEEERGRLHYVSRRRGQERLAELYWQAYGRGVGELSAYGLRHLPAHLAKAGRWDDLTAVLTDLRYLEAKVVAGRVFELAGDFTTAVEAMPPGHPHRQMLGLLEEALRRDLHFIHRHRENYPQALFQCLWNSCWWYDSPEAAEHYWLVEGAGTDDEAPWQRKGPKLFELMENWRALRCGCRPRPSWAHLLARAVLTHRHILMPAYILVMTAALCLLMWFAPIVGLCLGTFSAVWSLTGRRSGVNDEHEERFSARSRRARLAIVSRHAGLAILASLAVVLTAVFLSKPLVLLALPFLMIFLLIWSGLWAWLFAESFLVLVGFGTRLLFSARKALRRRGRRRPELRWLRSLRPPPVMLNGPSIATLSGHLQSVTCVAASPDGRMLAAGSVDGKVIVWDGATGRELLSFSDHHSADGPEAEVRHVEFLSDSRRVLSTTRFSLLLWDCQIGVLIRRLDCDDGEELSGVVQGFGDTPGAVLCSRKGYRVADPLTEEILREASFPDSDDLDWVIARAVAGDGSRMAIAAELRGKKLVQVWDLRSGARVAELAPSERVRCMALSLDGGAVALGTDEGVLLVWPVDQGGDCIRLQNPKRADPLFSPRLDANVFTWVTALAFSSDASRLAASFTNGLIEVWDWPRQELAEVLRGHTDGVQCARFFAGDRKILSGSADRTVKVWRLGAETRYRLQGNPFKIFLITIWNGAWVMARDRGSWDAVHNLVTGQCEMLSREESVFFGGMIGGVGLITSRGGGEREWPETEVCHTADGVAAWVPGSFRRGLGTEKGFEEVLPGSTWAGYCNNYLSIVQLEKD